MYWYGTEVLSPGPFVQPYSWFFDFNQGRQSITIQSSLGFAMLVHDGDIGTPISAVPEPQSLALLAQHRRTESDYMGVLLDTVTLNDWRSVVNGALQAAKAGDPQARNWLAQYLVGRPEGKAPTPMNIVVQQLSGADPVVEKLAKPAISRALYPSSHRNDDFEAHIKALVSIELQAKVKPLETIETTTTARLCDDSGAKPSNELD